MKRPLIFIMLLTAATAFGIEKGMSRSEVIKELGEPRGAMQYENKETLLFKTGSVTLQNGKVIRISLSEVNVEKAEERQAKAEEIRKAQQKELEREMLAFPEDTASRVGCTYTKKETWDFLPETFRPDKENFWYDVYLPPGYYESRDRVYPCLFLETPAFHDSIYMRVRKEKWIVVILLPDLRENSINISGDFVAAYDNALHRFRIAKNRCFILGGTSPALMAAMRPVAGIILHEPNFLGFKTHPVDFLRKNPHLRTYVLLGNSDRWNVEAQEAIMKNCLPENRKTFIYSGKDDRPTPALVDPAIDWLKKEYRLP